MFKSLQANKNQAQLKLDQLKQDFLEECVDHREERAGFRYLIENEEYTIKQINRDLDRVSNLIIKLCPNQQS